MKFAYLNMKSKARYKKDVTASFFFNARGELLEKSILGMYRSLLLQVLEGYPDLQEVLDDFELVSPNQNGCPSLNVLKSLFFNAITALGQRPFTCFVDALDECDEQQIVDMVLYFESLADISMEKGVPLRICFSSRHYPHITIQRGIRLTLEDQAGHAEDMAIYVSNHLRIDDPTLSEELQLQLLAKAAGVFMWVVLVVDILNKEYRRGGLALRKRLAEIPSDLSELFRDILRRDNENMEDLRLCILWILYAKRPLQPKEFYHALWSGLALKGLVDPEIPDVSSRNDSDNIYNKCVISSSKGLAEITKSQRPTIQFIHESVRDFLIKDRGLHELWPDLGLDFESPSHETLKQCCSRYLNHTLELAAVSRQLEDPTSAAHEEIPKMFPFLEYATHYILYHANSATKLVAQDEFLSTFPISNWVNASNLFEKFKVRLYSPGINLFYLLAERGLSELISTRLRNDQHIHAFGGRYRYPLFAALATGNGDAAAALLMSPSRFCEGVNITKGLNHRKDLKDYENRTPLSWAAQEGRAAIAKLLLETGSRVDEMDLGDQTPLTRALENRHEAVTKLLIDKGADVNASDKDGWTPLTRALRHGHEAVAKLLINKVADVNASDKDEWTPLIWASGTGHEAVTKLLIGKGADVNASDKDGWTPLIWASGTGHEAVAKLLINKGADVNASDKDGWTPLIRASKNGHEAVTKLLINKGADVNASNKDRWTPLIWALSNGHKAVAKLLINKGADANAIAKDGLVTCVSSN